MSNLIRKQNIIDNNKRSLTKVVLVSDGTNEANTVLVDVSSLRFALNANASIHRTTVKRVFGSSSGANSHVKLQWHGDANSEIVTFGSGMFDYDFQSMGDGAIITNPESNTSGDILISTAGLITNDLVTVFVDLRKDNRDYDAGQTADPKAFNL